jgi:hypothetical protein
MRNNSGGNFNLRMFKRELNRGSDVITNNYYDTIMDENENCFGEYMAYEEGNIYCRGFAYKDKWVGKLKYGYNLQDSAYYSFLEYEKEISEEQFNYEYRKYLVKHRLGEEVPESFLCLFRYLKDYEERELPY